MQHLKVFSVSALSAILVFALTSAAQAASVYGTAASFTGERSVADGELVVVDAQHPSLSTDAWDDGIVEWEIVANGPSYDYTYTFRNFQKPAISHLTLDLTDNAIDDPDAVTNVEINGNLVSSGNLSFGDAEGIIGGIKIDEGDDETYEDKMILTFTSNRAPVWGDISIEQGQEQAGSHFLVENAGFGNQTFEDVSKYIARPNGAVAAPTPAAATAGMVLLGGLMLRRRRRTPHTAQ